MPTDTYSHHARFSDFLCVPKVHKLYTIPQNISSSPLRPKESGIIAKEIDEQRLQELLDQKLSGREIARQLDVPHSTLQRHLQKSKRIPTVHQEVHIPDQLTDILDDLTEIAAWWRERKLLTQILDDPERETERKTYHIEKRHIEAIERAADFERVSITEIVNRAFAHHFSKP